MPKLPKYFQFIIRNAADDADDLILSSFPDDDNPYLIDPPNGDGESFDPLTGDPTTGSYSVTFQDPETSENTRVITSRLADVYGRQQYLMRKAKVRASADGAIWNTLTVGYITRISLINAAKFEFAIGQSRRIEKSRTVFKEATTQFPGVTCVIGGPVIGGFINDDFLPDYGGWTFEVDEDTAVHTKLALVEGFDPRKPLDSSGALDTFTSTSTAIADFTNDWARNYFEATSAYAASGIEGYFPGLRARLEPVIAGDAITLIPLARPATLGGVWYNPTSEADRLTGFGTSQLYLPKTGVKDDGTIVAFDPAIGVEYKVYVYAFAISKDNLLHWYGHPVDFWEAHRIDAGIAYDASVLPAVKERVGVDRRIAIRTGQSGKLADIDQKIVYGPFRLSSRIEDGEEVLFSTSVYGNDPPTDTITLAKLRSDEGTVFDNDEGTITTSIVVKSQKIRRWTRTDTEQPEIDGLISSDAYPQSITNSADDIPPGTENEQVLGDIPGAIWVDLSGPINLQNFLIDLGAELFDRAGRGFITCELKCLPSVTNKVGAEVLLDLPHLPGSLASESPVTQRGIAPMPFQIIQRTETPEGPDLVLVNSISSDLAGDGETPLLPEFTLEPSVVDDVRYGLVTITNADDLFAAELDCRCDYAVSPTEPISGTHFTTILWEFMTNPTFAFDVGPVAEESHLWVRLRAESPGFRPGEWTAWADVELSY